MPELPGITKWCQLDILNVIGAFKDERKLPLTLLEQIELAERLAKRFNVEIRMQLDRQRWLLKTASKPDDDLPKDSFNDLRKDVRDDGEARIPRR